MVDLRGLSFIDSSGLRAVLDGHAQHGSGGVDVHYLQPSDNLWRVFTVTGSDRLLPFDKPDSRPRQVRRRASWTPRASPFMQVAQETIDARTRVVVITGELVGTSGAQLVRAAREALDAAAERLIVDLTGMTFMDSGGLAALIANVVDHARAEGPLRGRPADRLARRAQPGAARGVGRLCRRGHARSRARHHRRLAEDLPARVPLAAELGDVLIVRLSLLLAQPAGPALRSASASVSWRQALPSGGTR